MPLSLTKWRVGCAILALRLAEAYGLVHAAERLAGDDAGFFDSFSEDFVHVAFVGENFATKAASIDMEDSSQSGEALLPFRMHGGGVFGAIEIDVLFGEVAGVNGVAAGAEVEVDGDRKL